MIPKKIYIDSKYFNAAHIDANKGMPSFFVSDTQRRMDP